MTVHDLLIDRIKHFEPVFPRTDESVFFENAQVVRCEVLRKIKFLPNFTDALLPFLKQAENAQTILVADDPHEGGGLCQGDRRTLRFAAG